MARLFYFTAGAFALAGATMTLAYMWSLNGTPGLIAALCLLPLMYFVLPLHLMLWSGAWLPVLVNFGLPVLLLWEASRATAQGSWATPEPRWAAGGLDGHPAR
jgi:uncharacterized membrane protein